MDLQVFILILAILIIAITIHEFAHAITADLLGDPTPRSQGRISLLPPDHLDPVGTVMMAISAWVGFGIGWGKPVLTNPRNFRNPRRDQGLVAIAGPISNILQAVVFAGIFALAGRPDYGQPLGLFLISGVTINLALAFFNLIPLAPLDGHWIVTAMLPYEQARRYFAWMQQYGQMVFIGLIILEPSLRIISSLIRPPMMFVASILLR